MRKALLAGAAMVALAVGAVPASATGFDAGISGTVTVAGDLSACATVTAPRGVAVAGEFSAAGEMQGPGTQVGTIHNAKPVVTTSGTWTGCIDGGYFGATAGEAKYTLVVGSAGGSHVTVTQCTIALGRLTCV